MEDPNDWRNFVRVDEAGNVIPLWPQSFVVIPLIDDTEDPVPDTQDTQQPVQDTQTAEPVEDDVLGDENNPNYEEDPAEDMVSDSDPEFAEEDGEFYERGAESRLVGQVLTKEMLAKIRLKSYQRGYKVGTRGTIGTLRNVYEKISYLVYHSVVKSERCYKMLRNLMTHELDSLRGPVDLKKKKKINDRILPTFAPVHRIRLMGNQNKLNLQEGNKLYVQPDGEYDVTESPHYIGVMLPLSDIIEGIGFERTNYPAREWKEIRMLAWCDGGRVDRGTVYGRVRFYDVTRTVWETGDSGSLWWYALYGKESDVRKIERLRNDELEDVEYALFNYKGITYKFVFKYVSGDHKMLWTEWGQWLPWRCTCCTISETILKMGIFEFNPEIRTMEVQKNLYASEVKCGATRPPIFGGADLIYKNDIITITPFMHDIKGVKTLQYVCIKLGEEVLAQSLTAARKLLDKNFIDAIGSTSVDYARQAREIFAHFEAVFGDFLPHQGWHNLGFLGATVSQLCYQKQEPEDQVLFWSQLLVCCWSFIELLRFYWRPLEGRFKKVPKCDSVYEHSVQQHFHEIYWETRILPLYFSEESEGSIKMAKNAKTNHQPLWSISHQLRHEQLIPISEGFLQKSDKSEYLKQIRTSRLPKVLLKHVLFAPCVWELDSFQNMLSLLMHRIPEIVEQSDHGVLVKIGDCEEELVFCLCGEHGLNSTSAFLVDYLNNIVDDDMFLINKLFGYHCK